MRCLERKGEPTLLVTTRGFRDALRIAYQDRPRLFDLNIVLARTAVLACDRSPRAHVARMVKWFSHWPNLCAPSCKPRLMTACAAWRLCSCTATATPLTSCGGARLPARWASANQRVAPGQPHDEAGRQRGDTTVVDAYLSPILRRYVEQVAGDMPGVKLFFMQSSGGLTDAHAFQGKDAILSAPPAASSAWCAPRTLADLDRVIGFDMGGTSTDVSHYAGEFERAFETQVAGVRMRAPMMSIHTVAAGGGSVLTFDGARFRAGPESAGANPGPASYRRGGPWP
jgi:5-oxoprolinase (ATP-hydrolysing)